MGEKSGEYGELADDGASRFDHGFHGGHAMGTEVVPDHDLARTQPGHQDVLYERQEGRAVGAARKHQCPEHALGRHGTDDCDVLAVIDGRVRHHALAGGSPTVRASHRHVEPRLIDHHDVFGVDQCLRDREARPLERDVGTVLFARVRRLFFLGRSIALSASPMVVSLTEMPVRAW